LPAPDFAVNPDYQGFPQQKLRSLLVHAEMEGPPANADALARLAQLESDFQRAIEVEKLEAVAEFAAGAGHEINNPLTVISGRAQLLLRDETDPERRHALALISTQAMRVYEMIADMMLFARPPRPELQRVELIGLIDGVLADFAPRSTAQQTTICRSGDPGPIFLEADAVQLQVALRALCQNSLEALQTGGHIEISVETDPGGAYIPACPSAESSQGREECPPRQFSDGIRIHVRDDGPGLKPEERRHAFDPFYSARQAGRGLGLGLSKAWRIVGNHGGRIEVDSQPGCGATFTIVLRRLDEISHA
jgi:signal transduction histidine kinase